jgi:putative transcriptional regulator
VIALLLGRGNQKCFLQILFALNTTIVCGSAYNSQALAHIIYVLTHIFYAYVHNLCYSVDISTIGGMKKMYCRLAVLMAEKDPQLSQRQLAKDTGLDITTINRLFTNNFSRVDVTTVEVLCNYFGKNVGDLFEMRKPEDIPKRKTRKRNRDDSELTEQAA